MESCNVYIVVLNYQYSFYYSGDLSSQFSITFQKLTVYFSNLQDPSTKYHGHLLLAHIIAKFAIHKRIVLQVTLTAPLILIVILGFAKCSVIPT